MNLKRELNISIEFKKIIIKFLISLKNKSTRSLNGMKNCIRTYKKKQNITTQRNTKKYIETKVRRRKSYVKRIKIS